MSCSGKLPCGHVTLGQGVALPLLANGADVVVAALVQHHVVYSGAGGDNAHDVPVHQALGGGWVLHLLADSHLVPLGDEPGQIGLRRVIGHAAHGHPLILRLIPVPGGEGQAQLFRTHLGVVVEHLIEVT